jgi:hypothetical protein
MTNMASRLKIVTPKNAIISPRFPEDWPVVNLPPWFQWRGLRLENPLL